MREIKFRAYNDGNGMRNVKAMALHGKELCLMSDGSKRERQDEIIMQFTGLKDKNGKEIYEGDILKIKINNNKELVEKVEWCEYRWYPFGERVPPNYTGSDIEVIGNIYENPELLTKEVD